jgi:hypothetical protein
VDALCGLGIAADHLVAIDLAGFAGMVDAVGGLQVEVPTPVRDPMAGLALSAAGSRTVDGDTALAMVRSRHPEHLVDGQWIPAVVDPDGRAASAGTLLSGLADAARAALRRPYRLPALSWAVSDAVSVDAGTSPAQLLTLLDKDLGEPTVLPVGDPLNGTLARFQIAETGEAVQAAGMSCSR